MSKVLDLLYKKEPGGELIKSDKLLLSKDNGIIGDYHGNSKTAQVTILTKDSWEKANNEINANLPWEKRRVNVLIDDIDLEDSIGKLLKIGNETILEITGECKPCALMEKTHTGLFKALESNWRGGIETVVIKDGQIKIGDEVSFI